MELMTELQTLLAEAMALIEAAKAEGGMTEEVTETYAKKTARIKEIKALLAKEKELASLSADVAPDKVEAAKEPEINQAVEAAIVDFAKASQKETKMEKTELNKSWEDLKIFARSPGKQEFTLTSGSNGGLLMPRTVLAAQLVRQPRNAFRAGFAALGVNTFSSSSTENAGVPFLDDSANVANDDQEGAASGASADASAANGSLDLVEYHSKATWYSKKLVYANDFDITQFVLPLHQSRIERQEEANWADLLIADTDIIGGTAASTSAVTYDELVEWDESIGVGYEVVPSFVIVSKTFRSLIRGLTDDEGRPLLKTGLEGKFDTLFGKPVITCASLEAVGAGNVVGAIVPVENVIIRDTTVNEFAKYENESGHPGKVGYELFGWSAFAYSKAAPRTFKMAIS